MRTYSNEDFYLSAYLLTTGYRLIEHTRTRGLTTFVFESTNDIHDAARQTVWRQGITQVHFDVEHRIVIGGSEFSSHAVSLQCLFRWRQGSPTNC